MRQKPSSCVGCALHSHGTDFSMIEGTGSSGVMLVAEASGEMEARDQLPLRPYAPSGSVLERVLRRMGLDRRMFSITNCVRCRPRNNWLENSPHEYAALNHCRPNLDAAIAQFKPRCIVALGGIALRELTGEAGEARGIGHLAGYVLPLASRGVAGGTHIEEEDVTANTCDKTESSGRCNLQPLDHSIPVIGNFHPSYLRRGKASHQGIFARILQRAVNIAAGRDREWMWGVDPNDKATWRGLRYSTHPSLDDAWGLYYHLRDNPNLPLAKDLETSESTSLDEDAREGFQSTEIRLIQFSAAKSSGMALPWEGEYREIAQRILHLPNPSYGHNWDNFDHKVLRAAALREGWRYAPTVRPHDTMNLFHHLQPDLPAHLQFCSQFISFPFPWKHRAGTDIEFYGCCDVDSDLQLGLYLEQKLKQDGLWGDATVGYYGQVYEVRPILAAMEDRGVPIDDAARLRLGAEFDAEQKRVGAELMPLFPESAKKLDPYKTFPPELKKLPEVQWGDLFQEPDKWKCRCGRECKMDVAQCTKCHGAQADGKVKAGKWYRYGQREVQIADAAVVNGEPRVVTTMEWRWCYIPEFNPNSGKQLIEYMKAKGHPVPKSKEEDDEGKQKDTTGKKELVRLARKVNDTFYLKVIEYRELGKLRGTYIEGFKPGPDGRVHTTFTFDTSIGQLSCLAPWVPVLTRVGHKMIKDVKVGDLVWTHKKRWRKVTATWIHPPAPMVDLHLNNGYVLTCTTAHKLLSSPHVNKPRMDDSRERAESIGEVSEQGCSHSNGPSERIRNHYPQHLRGTSADAFSGVRGAEETEVLALEDGSEKPHAGQDRRESPQLEGTRGRWTRVSDLLGGWEESVCSSTCDVAGTGPEGVARDIRCASYQQRQEGQPTGQSGSGYEAGAPYHTLISASGLSDVTIQKAVAVGSFPVHDITVEEDESYAACDVFSHNSRNPNVQNFIKHGRLAKATRAIIAAPPGYVLTEWDFKSCHVLTLGFLAEDANYIRCARIDMHSLMTGHYLKLWDIKKILAESDAELIARCKWLKSNPEYKHVRDAKVKHAGLGIGNGLKEKGLYERYMEYFASQREARDILRDYEQVFDKVFAWQKLIQQQAHRDQVLRTQFGHIRRFYEVFRWDAKKNCWGHGDQAEEAIAYWLANIAFGHIREKLKELHRAGLDEKYRLFNNIHDSFLFEVREDMLAEHCREVYPVLVTPSKVLKHPTICPDGLVIEVDGAWGRNWSEMQEMDMKAIRQSVEAEAACGIA